MLPAWAAAAQGHFIWAQISTSWSKLQAPRPHQGQNVWRSQVDGVEGVMVALRTRPWHRHVWNVPGKLMGEPLGPTHRWGWGSCGGECRKGAQAPVRWRRGGPWPTCWGEEGRGLPCVSRRRWRARCSRKGRQPWVSRPLGLTLCLRSVGSLSLWSP